MKCEICEQPCVKTVCGECRAVILINGVPAD